MKDTHNKDFEFLGKHAKKHAIKKEKNWVFCNGKSKFISSCEHQIWINFPYGFATHENMTSDPSLWK